MTDDEPQGTAHSLEMTALFISANLSVSPTSGTATYKLKFAYPEGYDQYLKQILRGAADMYINGQMAAQSALVANLSVKPQKDDDPLFVVVFQLDGGDATRFHIGELARTPACEIRLVSTQLAMFAN